MHLVGPWLTTTGKKKGKQQFRSAEQKQKLEQLALAQQAMYKKFGVEEGSRSKKNKPVFKTLTVKPAHPRYADQQYIPSLNSNTGDTLLRESTKYTGTLIKGIATMHKSNAVPVIDEEQMRDISRMRRG